ncbi:hypothetical protein [Ureibacillus acetophenoni]|uniref:PEGA domain-containing protein n=1 Tax=Ureibacillus acetophenoni TaxID=614649 RepID=A0A285UIJ7_9BACL|nr:hypothetical protein [Ureibacillus acetophenoni]SOC41517.1 hypothetical protein SAMN05877842_110128 [Ureibacillus acetophenoni]
MVSTLDKEFIRLKRTSQFANRARKFKVYLDNQYINDIANGEEISIPVRAGSHQLHITIDWVKSEKYEIELAKGDNINLLCGSPLKGIILWIPFVALISTFVPKWYLFIKKVDSEPF